MPLFAILNPPSQGTALKALSSPLAWSVLMSPEFPASVSVVTIGAHRAAMPGGRERDSIPKTLSLTKTSLKSKDEWSTHCKLSSFN